MRGVFLRCAHCMHWKDKLIAHFFLGFFTVLFAVSIYSMFQSLRRGACVNKPILIISGLLYLSCSTHFVLEFSEVYQFLCGLGPHYIKATQLLIPPQVLTILIDNSIGKIF